MKWENKRKSTTNECGIWLNFLHLFTVEIQLSVFPYTLLFITSTLELLMEMYIEMNGKLLQINSTFVK